MTPGGNHMGLGRARRFLVDWLDPTGLKRRKGTVGYQSEPYTAAQKQNGAG